MGPRGAGAPAERGGWNREALWNQSARNPAGVAPDSGERSTMIRQPAVAGQFYPASAAEIDAELGRWMHPAATPRPAVGIVVPHAGWMYSGATACKAYEAAFEQVRSKQAHRDQGAEQQEFILERHVDPTHERQFRSSALTPAYRRGFLACVF